MSCAYLSCGGGPLPVQRYKRVLSPSRGAEERRLPAGLQFQQHHAAGADHCTRAQHATPAVCADE